MKTFPVLSPLGFPPAVKARGLVQSLDTLNGKKVYLVDVGFENSDRFMVELGSWLSRNEPGIHTEIVRWHDMHRPDPELCERIRHDGDAAILGVGL